MTRDFFAKQLFLFIMDVFVGSIPLQTQTTCAPSQLDLFLTAHTSSHNLCAFVERYKPAPKICELIEKNKGKIADPWCSNHQNRKRTRHAPVKNFKILPGFYCKGPQVNRVINAARLRNYIEARNLDCLRVARKYIYPIDGILYVFCEEIKATDRHNLKPYTLQEVQQLAMVVEETGFTDFSLAVNPNVIRSDDDKLVFIDTEDRSFGAGAKQYLEQSPQKSKAQSLFNLLFYRDYMAKEAVTWLSERLATVLEMDNNIGDPSIVESSEFDDPDIDFEDVRKQAIDPINAVKTKVKPATKRNGDWYDHRFFR